MHQRLQALVVDMADKDIRLQEAHAQLERLFLREVMRRAKGNQCRAAEVLHMHRNTLRRKLERHGLLSAKPRGPSVSVRD